MKKFLFIALLSVVTMAARAQDIIVTADAEEIAAKIEEVGDRQIKYRKASNPDGPLFTMNIANIAMVKYSNGEIETFKAQKDAMRNAPSAAVNPAYTAQKTAKREYQPYTTAFDPKDLDVSRNDVCVGSRRLSAEEAQWLFGQVPGENYWERWQSASRRVRTGNALMFTGIPVMGAGVLTAMISGVVASTYVTKYTYWSDGSIDTEDMNADARGSAVTAVGIGLGVTVVGVALFVPGIVVKKAGRRQQTAILEDFGSHFSDNSYAVACRFGGTAQGIGFSVRF